MLRKIAAVSALALLVNGASLALAQEKTDCSSISGAALVHFQGPYTKALIDGATAAGEECGSKIKSGGPAQFDSSAQVAMFQDFVLSGVKAIVTVPFPADFWQRPIEDAVKQGVTVSSFDVEAPNAPISLHTAPKQQHLGRALADVLIKKVGSDAKGAIVTGICIPALGLLQARVTGFKNRIAEKMPGASIVGPLDVTFDQTENYSRWRSAVDANPGAIAYIGFCENDLPSLVRIKGSDPKATYQIAAIGVNPDGLKGISDGVALAAIGQKPFMQGYVAMRAMLVKLAAHQPVPHGWIDVGPETITTDNVKAITNREASISSGFGPTRKYYDAEIKAIFSDLDGHVQPYSALLGN
jgi:ribose transport system substrate-binding protein